MNLNKKFFAFFVLFSVLLAGVFADNSSVKELKKGAVYYQTLEWESSGYVKEYQVILEQKTDSGYKKIQTITTTETSYNVSLDTGSYRFKVYFYNVFGQKAFETEYKYFDILETYQPKISLDSDPSINTKEEKFSGEFVLNAKDLNASAQFYLIEAGNSENPKKIYPKNVVIKDDKVHLVFDTNNIPDGKYRIVVQNPGGLTATSKIIRINQEKEDFFNLALGMDLQFMLNDNFFNLYFDSSVLKLGYVMQTNYLHAFNDNIRAGVGLYFRHSLFGNTINAHELSGHLISLDLNGVFDYKIFTYKNMDFFLETYGGVGFEALNGLKVTYPDGSQSDTINSYLFNYDFGVAGKMVFQEKYTALFGVEYVAEIPAEGTVDYFTSCVVYISGGLQF